MRVKARRGVCVGVGRNLKAGEEADIDPGIVGFLVSIKAVEVIQDAPPQEEKPKQKPKADAKAPKPAQPATAGDKEK